MPKLMDLSNKSFGRWKVLALGGRSKQGKSTWVCQCECGTVSVVVGSSLVNGRSSSCGCLASELTIRRSTTHGLSKGHGAEKRLYIIWGNMKARCNRSTNPRFKDYGGRGISICYEWDNDFAMFYRWAMSNGYDDRLTIERIDNDRGYSPGNCKWIPREEQSRNRRKTKLNERKAEAIRNLKATGMKSSAVAKIFSIDRHHVNAIVRGDVWK